MSRKKSQSSEICLNCPYDQCYIDMVDEMTLWLGSRECKTCTNSSSGSNCIHCGDYNQMVICNIYLQDQLAKTTCNTECTIDLL